MRVQGNGFPAAVTVESYRPMPGYVEVRVRESVKNITPTDNGDAAPLYEYDEYVFHVKQRDGLQQKIENNLVDWLQTGRMLEVNDRASTVQDMKTEIADAITQAALDAAYREGVNSI